MTTLQKILGYTFQEIQWLEWALSHKSYKNEVQEDIADNERLEFLGDAVLDLALSDFLYRSFPDADEGHLSKWRASLVNTQTLADLGVQLGLDEKLQLGRGERESGGNQKPRLLAGAFEAVIGAVYLDSGYRDSALVVQNLYGPLLKKLDDEFHYREDYKTRYQELAQKEWKKTPTYQISGEEGPDHEKTFFVEVCIGDQVMAVGIGSSKKSAEQEAARQALEVSE